MSTKKESLEIKSEKTIIKNLFPEYLMDELVYEAKKFNSRLFKAKAHNPYKEKTMQIISQRGFEVKIPLIIKFFEESN